MFLSRFAQGISPRKFDMGVKLGPSSYVRIQIGVV